MSESVGVDRIQSDQSRRIRYQSANPGANPRKAAVLVQTDTGLAVRDALAVEPDDLEVARLPPLYPEWLGAASFLETHRVRFAYVAGEMARGIASVEMVVAMAHAGMLGFFGAAGLSRDEVASALTRLDQALGMNGLSWGVNLIHSPDVGGREDALVDLFLERSVRRVSASAFLELSPAVVRYAFHGMRQLDDGRIQRVNHVFAKLSRPEVARQFMAPPPPAILEALVSAGRLTRAEAALAKELPVAEDITAEADSGGHTDNRPLTALLPSLFAVRATLARACPASAAVRIGAAGGLGTPHAVAAAFAMGADYVVTGSINQSAVESGLAPIARKMLAGAGIADMVMAPSGDMFEMGVKVQVLRRGTMFAARANKLYELYRSHSGLDALPPATRAQLERDIFRSPLAEILQETHAFFARRDPAELVRAARDSQYEMALVFRWYIGLSSRWPIEPDLSRQMDFQIWCGPAMGAFNDWVAGSFLAEPENRSVVQIARNLMEGATQLIRAQQLRAAGVVVPSDAFGFVPREINDLATFPGFALEQTA